MEVFEGFELFERVRGGWNGVGWSGLVVNFSDWKGGAIEGVGVIEGVEDSAGGVKRVRCEFEPNRQGSKRGASTRFYLSIKVELLTLAVTRKTLQYTT